MSQGEMDVCKSFDTPVHSSFHPFKSVPLSHLKEKYLGMWKARHVMPQRCWERSIVVEFYVDLVLIELNVITTISLVIVNVVLIVVLIIFVIVFVIVMVVILVVVIDVDIVVVIILIVVVVVVVVVVHHDFPPKGNITT